MVDCRVPRLALQLSAMLAIFSFVVPVPTARKGAVKNEASSDPPLGCLLSLGNSIRFHGSLYKAIQYFYGNQDCRDILDAMRRKCVEVTDPSRPNFDLSPSNIFGVKRACNSVISVENLPIMVSSVVYQYLAGAGAALETGPTTQADILEYAFLFPTYFGTENRWYRECQQLTEGRLTELELNLTLHDITYGCQVFTS